MSEDRQRFDDPREAGGSAIDAGTPHDRRHVMFDTRRAVLVESIDTAVAHTTRNGRPAEDAVALVVSGRINRPPDDQSAARAPAEPVSHLHMLSWDAVADLIADLQALAATELTVEALWDFGRGRDGFDLTPLLEAKWASLEQRGLIRRAA